MAAGTHIWVVDLSWSVSGATPNPATWKKYVTFPSDYTTPQKTAAFNALLAFDLKNMKLAPNVITITNMQQFSP